MFWGEVEFKTPMPTNVVDTRYTYYIKSKTEILFTHEEAVQIAEVIRSGKLPQG